jgi:hypothetical protein
MTQALPSPPPLVSPVLTDEQQFTYVWSGWFRAVFNVLSPGITTTISLAKLTGGGANGSITIVKGIVTKYIAPT